MERKMKRNSLIVMLLVAFTLVLAACGPAATPEPTAVPEPTALPEPTAMPEPELADIVDTAVADGRFTTLVAAVGAAGLVDALKGEGPFTVFAPTDDAFAALPEGTVEELLKPENKQALTDILLYHVVEGKVMAADVTGLESATTLLGKDIAIKVDMGNVYINDAKVIITDIETSNGVIHVIDAVILPSDEEADHR
jgi:transforming growth factor-beta-induced protein